MKVDHWMMFATFAQQDAFSYPSADTYAGVVINGNMVAYAPAGLAAFLHEKTARANYIVDPLTHAFQHDPATVSNSEGRPKSSIASLAKALGAPVDETVGQRPLRPSDLNGPGVLEGFVERCLAFQRDHLRRCMSDTGAAKYLDPDEREVPPYALVAPYFFMSETTVDDWIDLNISCAEEAVTQVSGEHRVFASVVLDRGVLQDESARNRLVERYRTVGLNGVLIWVDSLDEYTASSHELECLVKLASGLRADIGREAINLHGGFFSILAASELGAGALSGVTHGPEFGEHRAVIPVGGGIPIARYYVPQLHSRVRYRDAVQLLKAKGWLRSAEAFHKNVCDCSECATTLSGDVGKFSLFGEANVRNVKRRAGLVRIEFPTPETSKRCLHHYLQRKDREYRAVENMTGAGLVQSISAGYHSLAEVAGPEAVRHLRVWLRALGQDIAPE